MERRDIEHLIELCKSEMNDMMFLFKEEIFAIQHNCITNPFVFERSVNENDIEDLTTQLRDNLTRNINTTTELMKIIKAKEKQDEQVKREQKGVTQQEMEE